MQKRKKIIKYLWIIFVLGLNFVNAAAEYEQQYREMIVGEYIGFDKNTFWRVEFKWQKNTNILTMTKTNVKTVKEETRSSGKGTTSIPFNMSDLYTPLLDPKANETVSLRKNGNIQIYDSTNNLTTVLYKFKEGYNAIATNRLTKLSTPDSTFDEKRKYFISIMPDICHYRTNAKELSDNMTSKIQNDDYNSPPFLLKNPGDRFKGLLNFGFGMCIFGIMCLVYGTCFLKQRYKEVNNQSRETNDQEEKSTKKYSSSTIFENKIESTYAEAIHISSSMLSNSDKIAAKSYEDIMRKHF